MTVKLRLTLAVTVIALLAGAPPAAGAQGCITSLPVNHSFKSQYSVSYRAGKLTVKVTSLGSWIHHTKAELYTFAGELVAQSKLYKRGFNTSKRLKMRLPYGSMQSGKYTLVVTGEPNSNRSCGPKSYTRVVEFYDCPKGLPLEFPDAPGGKAGDYGRWLSVHLRSTGGILRRVVIELFDFDNNLFARGKLKALFGTARVDLKLRHKLVNGGYTLIVSADGGLPRGCGDVESKKVLRFGKKPGGGSDQGEPDNGGSDGESPGFGGGDTGSGGEEGLVEGESDGFEA